MRKLVSLVYLLVFGYCSLGTTYKVNHGSSYALVEASSNTLIKGSNAHEKMLIASTTKLMTAIVVIEYYNLDEFVNISIQDVNAIGSKIYLYDGDFIKRKDLLYGLLLQSGNDCASVLSNQDNPAFIKLMNKTAQRIGMENTIFANSSGLDEREYNVSTAYDMGLLMNYCAKNRLFMAINGTKNYHFTSYLGHNYRFRNKHKLIGEKDGFIGGKTGYTKRAHRVLVSYFEKNGVAYSIVTIAHNDDWNFHTSLAHKTVDLQALVLLKSGDYSFSIAGNEYSYNIKKSIVMYYDETPKIAVLYQFSVMVIYINVYYDDELVKIIKIKV